MWIRFRTKCRSGIECEWEYAEISDDHGYDDLRDLVTEIGLLPYWETDHEGFRGIEAEQIISPPLSFLKEEREESLRIVARASKRAYELQLQIEALEKGTGE